MISPSRIFFLLPTVLWADIDPSSEELISLPQYLVTASRVANPTPIATYPQLVSQLRFEPLVDLQTRNLAEGQGDISIRGGIFENTGFKVGAATLFDPQTGHYFAEIPIAPVMTSPVEVYTGLENALQGFNTTVGTLNYGWAPLLEGHHGEATAGIGDHELNRQRLYIAYAEPLGDSKKFLGIDFDFSRSEANGTLSHGDHDFNRYASRLQYRSEQTQTDLFLGYQSKFFGWPNMYTPFGRNETEDLQTRLFILNHRIHHSGDDFLELTGYYRRHKDHYVLDRFNPSIFEAFHQTKVWSGGFQGRQTLPAFILHYGGQIVADEIDSTALTFGDFQSRSYYKFTLLPEKSFNLGQETTLTVSTGVSFDDTNRDSSVASPVVNLDLVRERGQGVHNRYYFEYAKTTQVPGYTAIASDPNDAGLFQGKQNLSREKSHNLEIGVDLERESWHTHLAFFYRLDRSLVDWTFVFGDPSAREANNVDIDTIGLEAFFIRRWKQLNLILGYTFLSKSEDYGSAAVDASFYALNFSRHRLTAALTYRLLENVEIRADNEYRDQEDNPLRDGPDEAVISSLVFSWYPNFIDGLELSAGVDNLFNSGFQEIPGVPASRRQFSFSASYRW